MREGKGDAWGMNNPDHHPTDPQTFLAYATADERERIRQAAEQLAARERDFHGIALEQERFAELRRQCDRRIKDLITERDTLAERRMRGDVILRGASAIASELEDCQAERAAYQTKLERLSGVDAAERLKAHGAARTDYANALCDVAARRLREQLEPIIASAGVDLLAAIGLGATRIGPEILIREASASILIPQFFGVSTVRAINIDATTWSTQVAAVATTAERAAA